MLGPRVHVAGRRIHEWHAGAALLLAGIATAIRGASLPLHGTVALVLIGAYLVAKDWRDLVPGKRDTGAWGIGLHRPPLALRPAHRADWLPGVAAALAALIGALNVLTALAWELPARLRSVSLSAPQELLVGIPTLTLPAGLALIGAAVFLQRRRRRALHVTVGLLAVLGTLSMVRGFDVLETTLSWALAALLLWGREAFRVDHDTGAVPAALRRCATVIAGACAAAVVIVAAAAHWTSPDPTGAQVLREAAGLLTLTGGPLTFSGPATWIPGLLGLVGTATCAISAWWLVRPRATTPVGAGLGRAASIVRIHGGDTLSYFKLRQDLSRRFSQDGSAFVAYRVEHGTLLLQGDPVGPAQALPGLLADVCRFADRHGLKVACVGAGEQFRELARGAGLRSFYVGDEAIVETASFTLEGKQIKKVRQATHRLQKAGYTVAAHTVSDLTGAQLERLEVLSDRWRDGAPERGFSMAMDSLRNPLVRDTLVVVAYDADGHARGFLHFVPSFGRGALSLSLMRRDRDTPNGLIDFLVVRAIELARERGVDEVSMNFAAFARVLHSPQGRRDQILARVVRWGNPWFQIESLYSFNAKFMPRWEPRFLLYDGAAGLPRAAIAALQAEGQLPQPAWVTRRRARSADRRRRTTTPADVIPAT